MSAEAKPNWWYLEDTTKIIPGYMVPVDHAIPYWTSQLLSEEEADTVYHEVVAQYTKKQLSRVYQWDGRGSEINLDSRYTHYYDPWTLPLATEINNRFNAEVEKMAQTWWGCSSTPVYAPQVLGYEEKCQFRSHCDNSINSGSGWMRNDPTRDITALLYVSDYVPTVSRHNQHSGGELLLDNIMTPNGVVRIQPRKGQFVAFPSHPMYRHQVTPVSRGYRTAWVNWWTLR